MTDHEWHDDVLPALIADELEKRDDTGLVRSERFITWLARDLRDAQGIEVRAADEIAAHAFALRVRAQMHAERVQRTLASRPLALRRATMRATVAQSIQAAAFAKCAPLLELAAAAGSGRALWDEICEEWVEVPGEVSPAKHVAIRVAGDSMLPVLRPRDVILVKLDTPPINGDLVVARLDDDGYVVKRFENVDEKRVELSSLNPAYQPLVAERRRVSVLGTVVARFHVASTV